MRNLTLGLILYCAIPAIATAQGVKGTIKDTVEKTVLANASVVLIRQQDSIMMACTRAGNDGSFILGDIPNDKYVLMFTFPKYADYVMEIDADIVITDGCKTVLTERFFV
jgi:hypothetical protein